MRQHISADMVSGALAILIGGFVCLYGLATYDMGTIRRMGPGMVPVAAGAILGVLGLMLLISSALSRRRAQHQPIAFQPLFFVLAGVGAFALALRTLGATPAVILLVLISSRADRALSLPAALALAIGLAALIYLIFGLGLGLPLQFFRWSF